MHSQDEFAKELASWKKAGGIYKRSQVPGNPRNYSVAASVIREEWLLQPVMK
jgi:hypothetical protein